MNNQRIIEERRKIIDLNSFELELVYEKINKYEYGEEFLKRIFECYRCYLNNLCISSIIVGGEAIFRALCDLVKRTMIDRKEEKVVINKKVIEYQQLIEEPFYLTDKLNFNDLITYLKDQKIYDSHIIENLRKVKNLRNAAVHSTIPLLIDWDPEDPRSANDLSKLLRGESTIPEAYKVIMKNDSINFDCRKYNISLKLLDVESRIAVIQLVYIRELLISIFDDEMPFV